MAFGLDDAASAFFQIVNKFIPDPAQKAAAIQEHEKLVQEMNLAILNADKEIATAQIEVNKVEAASENLFVSGARPFILWVCGIALAYHFVLQPLITFVLAAFDHMIVLPVFDMDTLNTVLMGLLGLGGLRTVEKTIGKR